MSTEIGLSDGDDYVPDFMKPARKSRGTTKSSGSKTPLQVDREDLSDASGHSNKRRSLRKERPPSLSSSMQSGSSDLDLIEKTDTTEIRSKLEFCKGDDDDEELEHINLFPKSDSSSHAARPSKTAHGSSVTRNGTKLQKKSHSLYVASPIDSSSRNAQRPPNSGESDGSIIPSSGRQQEVHVGKFSLKPTKGNAKPLRPNIHGSREDFMNSVRTKKDQVAHINPITQAATGTGTYSKPTKAASIWPAASAMKKAQPHPFKGSGKKDFSSFTPKRNGPEPINSIIDSRPSLLDQVMSLMIQRHTKKAYVPHSNEVVMEALPERNVLRKRINPDSREAKL